MSLERAVTLSADLVQRRADLIRLFGEARYQERTSLAKDRIREVMSLQKSDNPISAITYCKHLAAQHPGEDVSTTQQFVLAAAADLAEGK